MFILIYEKICTNLISAMYKAKDKLKIYQLRFKCSFLDSLISSIMKLYERVIEQRLRSHLEQIGFISKHQSGFRRAKSTDDHLFRLSQSIMEGFNRREHVVAAFLDNVWHNRLRYKIFQLDLDTLAL